MNIDKEAEVIAGFTSKHIMVLAGGLVVDVILSFLLNKFFHNSLIIFAFFVFVAVNIIVVVKFSQNLPDHFFANFLESLSLPKLYMPGDDNEPDQE
jgi:uncharacterized membrane protein